MLDDLTGLVIPIAAMLMVVALRYMKYKQSTAGQMSTQEVTALEQMNEIAQRLERRVVTLERILDSEVPSWRDNPAHFYQQASHER